MMKRGEVQCLTNSLLYFVSFAPFLDLSKLPKYGLSILLPCVSLSEFPFLYKLYLFVCLFALSQKSEKLFSFQAREVIFNGDAYLSIYLVLLVFFLICVHLVYYQETVAML